MKLHKKARAFKKSILDEYALAPDEIKILDGACDLLSIYWSASDTLEKEGMVFKADNGLIRQHPCVGIVKNSWAGFISGCRLLQIGKPQDVVPNRPGRPDGGFKGAND